MVTARTDARQSPRRAPGSKAAGGEPAFWRLRVGGDDIAIPKSGGPGAALLMRTLRAFGRVIEDNPRLVDSALQAPTDAGGLAVLASAAAALPAVEELDPAARLLAEGAQYKTELLTRAGGSIGVGEVAELLGISRQGVDKQRKAGKLIALPAGSDLRYPSCQFTRRGLVAGLQQVLKALPIQDGWMRLEWLLTADDALRGQTPLQALQAGQDAAVMDLAAGHGGQ